MPRPGFVLEVDERTPPLLVHQGEGFRLQRFPLGSRVVYPPDSLPGIKDVNGAIRHALLNPIDAEPLSELLTPGMKLTIAIDDISLPLPPMTTPDIRQRIIEHVIELAARKGVEDVKLIVANALHRRMTADEIKRMVGERVFRSFWPDDLANFDAEDRDELTEIGVTDRARGRRDLEARGGLRPDRVREHQPGGDGRRAQVRGGRAGELPEPQAPPQRRDDDALALVHGPAARSQRDQRLRHADGPAAGRERREDLPDRDHGQQRHVPVEPGLPEQARVGVVRVRPGADDDREEGERHGAAARAPRVLPADRGARTS